MRAIVLLTCLAACGSASDDDHPGDDDAPPTADAGPGADAAPQVAICQDGDTTPCTSLAGLYSGGTASCRSHHHGWDVSSCTSKSNSNNPQNPVTETVYPAQRDARWSNARCSHDGDWVFEISVPPNPDGTWVIELEGGGFCATDDDVGSSEATCQDRDRWKVEPVMTNGMHFPDDKFVRNAARNTDPGFERSITVHTQYCSNDLWTGTNTTGIDVHWLEDGSYKKWPFTGHLNVLAMLDILRERYGLDDDLPLAIHVRGQSAGGWGVLNNAYTFKERFPRIAAAGNLLLSSWEGFIPTTWSDARFPVFGVPGLTGASAFLLAKTNWGSALTPQCLAAEDAEHQQDCISGDTLYELITGPESEGGMDLPLFIYQNRQDQLYMSLLSIEPRRTPPVALQQEGRDEFIAIMNQAMGITPGQDGSSRIKWLYAPSDPDMVLASGHLEPNVHPPLCYEQGPPDGYSNSVEAATTRFWASRGQGPGRGRAPGEVHLYDLNWVTSSNCPVVGP